MWCNCLSFFEDEAYQITMRSQAKIMDGFPQLFLEMIMVLRWFAANEEPECEIDLKCYNYTEFGKIGLFWVILSLIQVIKTSVFAYQSGIVLCCKDHYHGEAGDQCVDEQVEKGAFDGTGKYGNHVHDEEHEGGYMATNMTQ